MKLIFYDDYLDDIGDRIFVYGSNWRGAHGKGSALLAKQRYGAIQGQALGRQGQAYAVPTKDYFIQCMTLDQIEPNIDIFKDYVKANPKLSFYVTPLGTGLAGHSHKDIAPMFKGDYGMESCMFYRAWEPYLI